MGYQECPSGGCGCLLAGEKNTRWYRIKILNGGILEFNLNSYPANSADYDFAVWNTGNSTICPSGALLDNPDRCNFAQPPQLTGLKGTTNGNSNGSSGNLFSNRMTVAAGDNIFILIDNYDGNELGFSLDFFGPGIGTTATFDCSVINTCSSCNDPDCKTVRFPDAGSYSFAETASEGGCHSPFAYTSVKTATVCGTFTLLDGSNTVEFPLDRGLEITATNGYSTSTCLNSKIITYQVWDDCATLIPPTPSGSGFYTGLTSGITYKVCKTVTVSGSDCWLSRICLPYWTVVANDVQCNATPLTIGTTLSNQTNAGATTSFNAGCTGYSDIWYSFVAPASGRIQITASPNASSDVKISLIGPMAGLDGGIDDCNLSCSQMTNVVEGCNDYAGTGGIERLFAFVVPGQTYYVWVSGTLSRPTANFSILVTENISSTAQPTPGPQIIGLPDLIPSNNECSGAVDISPLCSTISGTNIGATASCTDPDPEYVDAITLENNVWYKWTCPPANGNAEITFELTSISCTAGINGSNEVQFGIFKGSCASLIPVISGTTSLTFIPTSGTTYYFVIDGDAGAQCNFNVQIKRPTITTQSCTPGNYCVGSSLPATFYYSYSGKNPGYRWAYCKSSTYNSACIINIDDPNTYSIYNSASGLPDPGCTPATYTFVGYLLADNGATTIAPGYPTPQPSSANCIRSTTPCTFNIFPRLQNYVTVNADGCKQVVTVSASCSSSVTVTGNTNQTVPRGTVGGNFTPVTINFNAPFGSPPALCGNMTVQTPINCPNLGATDPCNATLLSHGTAGIATNNNVPQQAVENTTSSDCADGYGSGVWFKFIAPSSGNTNINLTNVGTGDDLDAVIYLLSSRDQDNSDCSYPNDKIFDFSPDDCSDCSSIRTSLCVLVDHFIQCADVGGVNVNETLIATGLNPGEEYYIMIDGYHSGTTSRRNGNFTIAITNPGGGPIRPANDNCSGAIDISTIGCNPQPGNNINATSICNGDPVVFTSTENSVWYTYTPSYTGIHIVNYRNANGPYCVGYYGANPGIQFAMYTSNDNTCSGTFTQVPNSVQNGGTTSGSVSLNLTAGQKYYIFIDGYGGNECTYEFQIYNKSLCCSANLGATEGPVGIVLCAGEQVTFGVTANPIDFGTAVKDNPVIGWQFSEAQPTGAALDPFHESNNGKGFFVGQTDIISPATNTTTIYKDWQGNYETESDIGTLDGTISKTVNISGFPAGSTFNTTTDTITVCVYFYMQSFDNLWLRLRAPDGTTYTLADDNCSSQSGYLHTCFSNRNTSGNITTSCPSGYSNEVVTGTFTPEGGWSGLNGEGINGTWTLEFEDNWADFNGIWFDGFNLEIKKPITETTNPVIGTRHGDLTITNNDPFKYGPQTFWLTPVTFIDYDPSTGILMSDTCYSYGTPVKVTLLERVTTPTYSATCASPGDGSNGITVTLTSPSGGLPGIPLMTTGMNAIISPQFDNTSNLGGSNSCGGAGVDDSSLIVIPASSFSGSPTLANVNDITVCLSVEHEYFQDLDAYIVAPDGKCAALFTDVGPAGIGNMNNVCFNTSNSTNISTYTSGDLIDVYRAPETSISALLGAPLEGTWSVHFYDDGNSDVGQVYQASIILQTPTSEVYTVTGTGAANSITFLSPPVQESEDANTFSVADGQAWSVKFRDNNNCQSIISSVYNKPNLGAIDMDDNTCDGLAVPFTVTTLPPRFTKYKITLDFDAYPQDVNWILYDGNNTIVATGGGYTLGGATFTTSNLDPEKGPYKFVINDDYEDGFGSGGGTSTGGGTSAQNFIKIEELFSNGTSNIIVNEIYSFCTVLYCIGPMSSVFNQKEFILGTPTGTFLSGVTATLHNGNACAGASISGGITLNNDGSGIVNTTAAGVNAGSTYSIKYEYTDVNGCKQTLCRALNVYPTLTFAPTVQCPASLATVNPTCTGCNSTYVAEYSYNDGNTWTTATSSTLYSLYLYGRIRNTVTDEVGCEIVSIKLAYCPPVDLPVELLYLDANPIDNNYIKVSWSTNTEINTDRFEVYRSTDLVNFTKISTHKAEGNSNQIIDYNFDDYNVDKNLIYYYKIKIIDNDNTNSYSDIVSAMLNDEFSEDYIKILPNPASNYSKIITNNLNAKDYHVRIFLENGQLVFDNEYYNYKGLHIIEIDISKWADGNYIYLIENKEDSFSKKVIIKK